AGTQRVELRADQVGPLGNGVPAFTERVRGPFDLPGLGDQWVRLTFRRFVGPVHTAADRASVRWRGDGLPDLGEKLRGALGFGAALAPPMPGDQRAVLAAGEGHVAEPALFEPVPLGEVGFVLFQRGLDLFAVV